MNILRWTLQPGLLFAVATVGLSQAPITRTFEVSANAFSGSFSSYQFEEFLEVIDGSILESSFVGSLVWTVSAEAAPTSGPCGYDPALCGTPYSPAPVVFSPWVSVYDSEGGYLAGNGVSLGTRDGCSGGSFPYSWGPTTIQVALDTGSLYAEYLPELTIDHDGWDYPQCTSQSGYGAPLGSPSSTYLLVGTLTVTYTPDQRAFGRAWPIDQGLGQPWCVQTSDVDLDGDLDVLVAARSDDAIGWYQNDGTGQFGPWQAVTTEAEGVFSFVPADLDGDGDDDILVASDEDDTLAWHENTGGAFGPRQPISTSVNGARSVVAADLDGDGALDAVVGSMNDDSVSWFRNLGGGAFGSRELITTTADFVLCVDAADMDGDGDVDVLSASRDDRTVAWYANDGTGSGWGRTLVSTDLEKPSFVRAADLDGDGDTDVVATSLEYGLVARFLNGGVGDFPADSAPVVGAGIQRASALALADVDLDGDIDVLTSSYGPTPSASTPAAGKIAWFEAAEPGAFLPEKNLAGDLARASFVHCADVTGDGRPDVLATSYVDGSLWLFDNRIPEFTDPVWVFEPSGEPTGKRYDMDGDGDYDVMNGTVCQENLGGGVFGAPVDLSGGQTLTCDNPDPQNLLASSSWLSGIIDIDLDGKRDLLYGTRWGDSTAATDVYCARVNTGLHQPFVAAASVTDTGCPTDMFYSLFVPGFGALVQQYPNYGGCRMWLTYEACCWACVATFADSAEVGVNDSGFFVADYGGCYGSPEEGTLLFSTQVEFDLESQLWGITDWNEDGSPDWLFYPPWRSAFGQSQWTVSSNSGTQSYPLQWGALWAVNSSGELIAVEERAALSIQGLALDYTYYPPAVAGLADLNGDGTRDLVTETGDSWRPGLGSDQFAAARPLPASPLTGALWSGQLDNGVAEGTPLRDVNGDGRADFVTQHQGQHGWWLNLEFPDCNGNGIDDAEDLLAGTSADCDGNGVPDECDIASGAVRDLNGNGVPDACETIGTRYCSPAVANSTGASGELDVLGSVFIGQNDVTLTARQLPQSSFGFFITSQTPASVNPVANSMGTLCVTGAVGRYVGPGQLVNSGSTGTVALPIDLGAMPTPTGLVAATLFSTWHFQLWHRDASGGQTTSNFTDAVAVTFQ